MKVSVYIPVFNSERYLAATIEALLAQTRAFDEIMIVDDGSTDGSLQVAEKYDVMIVRHSENRGIAAARNTAIAKASCELIAAVDADCLLRKDWLECCLPYFEDEVVAGLGGRMDESVETLADTWRLHNLRQHFGDTEKKVAFLAGSNTIFRKSILQKAGLYAEKYRRNHEDTDLSERVRALGGELVYVPHARSIHLKRDTVLSVMRTCWGFRHREYPATIGRLCLDMTQELLHAFSMIAKSIIHLRFYFIPMNCIYPFIQWYFSIKAYILKTAQFE